MDKRIKLFVDAHSFDKEYQGVRTYIKEIYNILLEDYPLLDIYFGASNVEQVRANFPLAKTENIIQYKNRINLLRFKKDIPSLIEKHKIEFAHFQYLSPFGKKKCVYIVTTHDILFNDFKSDFSFTYRFSRNFLFKRGIWQADIKTTVSEYSKERIDHYFHVPANNIHVVPDGVNAGFAGRFNSNGEAASFISAKYNITNYILYVSRIEPRKNHVALLKGYIEAGLYHKDISLVFIGKESMVVKGLKEYLDTLSADQKKNIYWLSQVGQEDLEAFYKGCRIFAYVSKGEGFGIPPLEAAVAQVPVLCSNQTAMSEYDFFKPHFFNPYDLPELMQKLTNLLNNPPDSFQLEKIAAEVVRRYSWKSSAGELYRLITGYRSLQ
ncbi:MAG: glycosyltransferase family 1 protein [Ginsengibacter sp.]